MAYDVEDKVVQMRFDNREFDPNIDASIKSLEKLERSLQLADGTKGLQNIEKSAKNFNLNPAVTAVEGLKNGFSAMEVVAITAISNITNRAMAMGSQLINAFAIAPVKSGFAEYSEQMNSTQVIMSNLTDTTLPEVTAALDVLNEYADRTIYSFGQMTQAIGKFAAAGVDLGPATKAIQGLSSAAATVGANNQQLFSAYYNLAQSLQLGYMQLIDWKSLENSTIGNKTMRKAFVDTAVQMKKFTKDSEIAKKAYSDFRGSLSEKWLTTDVIIETLQKYSRQIKEFEDGFYAVDAAGNKVGKAFEEIKDSATGVTKYVSETYGTLEDWEVELASTAFKAATEVKSFKQMWETLTEAAGTGWAETWKIIFGDLEQAKHLWTEVSKPIEKVISVFNEVRNTALEAWAALGGREDLQATLINLSKAFGTLGDTVKMTIDKIFGTTTVVIDKSTGATRTVSNLYLEFLKATRVLKIFSEYLIMSDEEIDKVSSSLATLLKPLRIVGKVLSFVGKALLSIIVMGVAIVQTIIDIAANLDIIPGIIDSIFGAGSWNKFLETLTFILNIVGNLVGLFFDLGRTIFDAIQLALGPVKSLLAGFLGADEQALHFANVFEFIGNAVIFAINGLNNFITAIRNIIKAFDSFFRGDVSSLTEAFGAVRGGNFVQGIVQGAQNMIGPLAKVGSRLGIALSSAFDKVLGIHSPARVGKKSGRFYGLGAAEGTEETEPKVEKAGEHLAESLNRGFTDRVKEAVKEYATDKKDIFNLNDATKIEVSDNARQSLDRQLEQVQSFSDAVEETGQNVDELQEDTSTLEKIFTSIGSVISTIWDKVSTFVSNISVGQIIIIAYAAAIITLVFNIARVVGEATEVFEGFGRVLKAKAGRIWAEAFDQISQALFNLAKAMALLVLVANFDPKGLKQAAIVMGIFLTAITALVVVFSRLVTVTDKLKTIKNAGEAIKSLGSAISKVFDLFSIAMMIAALSFSIMMLTNSLSTLSQIDTASLWKGLAVLVILLGTMTAIIFILSKNTVQLTAGTVLIFAYSYALKLFSNALASISDGFSANIQKITSMTFKEIAVLISLVLGLTVLSVYINKASFALSKVILSLTLLAIGFGLVVAVMGIFNDNPLAESMITAMSDWRLWVAVGATAVAILAAFAIVSTQLANISKKTKTDLNKLYTGMAGLSKIFAQLSITLIVVMAGIAGIMTLLSYSISKIGVGNTAAALGMSVVLVASIIGALILLVNVFVKAGKDIKKGEVDEKIFDSLVVTIRSITGSIIALTITMIALVGASMLFWNQYKDNPWQGILVLGTSLVILASVMGMIAGALVVLGRNFKGDNSAGKNVLQSMIPIIVLVGELLSVMALFSTFKDPRSLIPGIIAINAVMAPLIALMAVMGQLGSVFEKTDKNGFTSKKKDADSIEALFKPLIVIFSAIELFIVEISALSLLLNKDINNGTFNKESLIYPLVIFYSIMGMVIATIWALNDMGEKAGKVSNPTALIQSLERIALILVAIGGLVATVAGSIYLISLGKFNAAGAITVMQSLGAVVGAALVAVTMMIKKLGGQTITLDKVQSIGALIGIIGSLAVIVAGAVTLISASKFNAGGVVAIIQSLGAVVGAALVAVMIMVERLGNNKAVPSMEKIRNIGVMLALLGSLALTISTSIAIMKGVPLKTALAEIGALTAAIAIIGGVAFLLLKFGDIGKRVVNTKDILQVATIFSGFALVMISIGASIAIAGKALENVNADTLSVFTNFASRLLGMLSVFLLITSLINKINGQALAEEGGVIGSLGKFLGGSGSLGDSVNIGRMFTQIAIGITILASAMFILAQVPSDRINQLVGTIVLLTATLGGLSAALMVMNKLFNGSGDYTQIGVMCIQLASGISILAAAMFALSLVPSDKVGSTITMMLTLVSSLTIISAVLTIVSKLANDDMTSIGVMCIQLASGLTILSIAMIMLSLIPTDKVNDVIVTLFAMVGALTALSVVAVIISKLNQYALLGAAVIMVMAAAMIAGAVAVNILSQSDLVGLADKLAYMRDVFTSSLGPSWQFIGMFAALVAILTLGGPGILIASVAMLAFAVAMQSLTATLSQLTALSASLIALIDAISGFKDLLVPFGIFLGLLTLFAPGVIIAALAINIILGSITIFIASLSLLSNAIINLTNVLMPFTVSLREVGKYIAEHYMSFVTLGEAIMGLGIACAVAAPGLLALAGAIGIIIVAIGVAVGIIVIALGAALALAAPFFATLIIGFGLLTAAALDLKDVLIEFIDQMIERLPTIISLAKEFAPMADDMIRMGTALMYLGGGLIVFGLGGLLSAAGILAFIGVLKVLDNTLNGLSHLEEIKNTLVSVFQYMIDNKEGVDNVIGSIALFGLALILLGAGAIVASLGILAITGALKVMSLVVGSFNEFIEKLKTLFENGGKIAALAAAFIALGLGLFVLGIGSIVGSLGLLALSGALAVMSNVMGGMEGIQNFLSFLIENRGPIAGVGGVLAVLGAGLAVLGIGLAVLAVPVMLISAVLTVLAAILMIVATICVTVLAPAISMIALALTPCVAAFTALVTALSLLNQSGNLMQLGLGLMFIAGGMIALGAASVIVSLVAAPMTIMIQLLNMMMAIIPNVSKSIVMFSTSIRIAAINVAASISLMANAISQGIQQIVEAVAGVMNLAEQGANIAISLIAGFTEGINSTITTIGDTTTRIIDAITTPILKALGIASPSKWFKWVADMCTQGFTQETLKQCPAFQNAGQAAGNAAGSGFLNTVKGWFSGSKVGNIITGGINKVKNGINNILGKDNKLAKGWQTVKDIFSGNFNFGDLAGKLGLDKIAENFDFSKATSGLDNFASGLGDVGTAAQTTKGTLEELTDTIKNQMQIFERFNDEDIIDPKELIHNMESQLRGIRNWANGIDILAERGASAGLIQYLSELGPQGYKYVESFLEMTSDQFAKANSLFTESLSLPDEAANTLLDGYRKSGAEIVEAVNDGLNQGIGSGTSAAVDTFDSAMTQMKDGASEAGQQILDTAVNKGGMTATAIRTLAGEAGEDAIFYYSEALETWFTSAEYEALDEEMKSKLGNLWQFTAGDMMKKAGRNVDTSKTIFDHDYLNKLSQEDGVFYLDGFGKALSSTQYIAECMKRGGQLLPAVIDDTVKPADLGNTMGLTSIEAAQLAFENGVQDVSDSIADLFNRAYEFSEDYIALSGKDSADTYMDSAVDEINDRSTDLSNAIEETWSSAMEKTQSYWDKMQSAYEQQQKRMKQNGSYTSQGYADGIKDNTSTVKKAAKGLADAGNNEIEKTNQINSPSKVTHNYGMYWVMGLANGIRDYAYLVSNAADSLTANPIDSLSDTINQISGMFSEDLDTNPTITPVLDMSNVESGASELDTLFSTQQAQIAANANIRYTHDDSVNRLKAAYADVLSKSNAELINAIQNTEQPINVNVVLQGDASTFFSAMVDQTRNTVASGGMNPFLITNRNSINAALV